METNENVDVNDIENTDIGSDQTEQVLNESDQSQITDSDVIENDIVDDNQESVQESDDQSQFSYYTDEEGNNYLNVYSDDTALIDAINQHDANVMGYLSTLSNNNVAMPLDEISGNMEIVTSTIVEESEHNIFNTKLDDLSLTDQLLIIILLVLLLQIVFKFINRLL